MVPDSSYTRMVRPGFVPLRSTGTHDAQCSENKNKNCVPRHRKDAENREQHQCKTLLVQFRVPKVVQGCLITCGLVRSVAPK